eukprot:TRINITY_DN3542_c1_g1_i2.p1 TRINITY_DN3542_c1_g1~~TRINITY_DN3542_c1_g1_i2.p1  ORF type:complete len:501 (-),score=132.04 TRINITY_DN3542_c1_g1_i2:106-1608(-)
MEGGGASQATASRIPPTALPHLRGRDASGRPGADGRGRDGGGAPEVDPLLDPLMQGASKLYQRRREIEAQLRRDFSLPAEIEAGLRRRAGGWGRRPAERTGESAPPVGGRPSSRGGDDAGFPPPPLLPGICQPRPPPRAGRERSRPAPPSQDAPPRGTPLHGDRGAPSPWFGGYANPTPPPPPPREPREVPGRGAMETSGLADTQQERMKQREAEEAWEREIRKKFAEDKQERRMRSTYLGARDRPAQAGGREQKPEEERVSWEQRNERAAEAAAAQAAARAAQQRGYEEPGDQRRKAAADAEERRREFLREQAERRRQREQEQAADTHQRREQRTPEPTWNQGGRSSPSPSSPPQHHQRDRREEDYFERRERRRWREPLSPEEKEERQRHQQQQQQAAEESPEPPKRAAYMQRSLNKSTSLPALRQRCAAKEEVVRRAEAAAMQELNAVFQIAHKKDRLKRFKELLRAWHPDKNPSNAEVATAVFQRLQAERAKVMGTS